MPSPLSRRAVATAAAAVTAVALTLAGGTLPASAAPAGSFPGSVPRWAKHANDAGRVVNDHLVEGEIYFALKDPAGAERLATAVSTPGSGRYGDYISPSRWIRRFAPEKKDYDAVVGFLKASGLTITGTVDSRLLVVFRGTAEEMDQTFGADLHSYRYKGHLVVAPAKAPTLPDSVSGAVVGVRLDGARFLSRPNTIKASDLKVPADPTPVGVDTPCSTYYGQHTVTLPEAYGKTSFPTNICGYVGKQLRAAYGVPSSADGRGQTVAVVDAYASPTIVEDVNTYAKRNGGTSISGLYSQITPSEYYDVKACAGRGGWQIEQTLDVEAVHNMARSARILYSGGFNCGGGLDVAVSRILDHRLATIVSNSYGDLGELPPDLVIGETNQQLQAAAEGIGLYYASGDSGDTAALTGVAQPGFFATSPWVTGVGGTSLGVKKNGSVALDTGWGTSAALVVQEDSGALGYLTDPPGDFLGGAGGGTSTVYPQPSYQAGVVPDAYSAGRSVPDVAADADPYTGQLVGVRPLHDKTGRTGKYEEDTYGGTSLASPLVAAQMALIQQRSGIVFGFANPVLYKLAADRSDTGDPVANVFRDAVPARTGFAYGSEAGGFLALISVDTDSSLATAPGYDQVTGLGSIVFSNAKRMAAITKS